MNYSDKKAIRGTYVRFLNNPFIVGPEQALDSCSDGIIVFENGIITAIGSADDVINSGILDDGTHVEFYRDAVIIPGFIDSHVHAAQVDVAASYGEKLLDWLNKYTFPAEMRLENPYYAAEIARIFLGECIANGITLPVAFATSYPNFTDAVFAEAEKIGMRIISGSVFMNRNVPEKLAMDSAANYAASQTLINKWHKRGRAQYSVIDRFAITSTPEELEIVSELFKNNPGVYFHTHLSENTDEVAFTKALFPERNGYLDIYDYYGLITDKSIFAHSIHLTDSEIDRLADAGAVVAHSSGSNLFLGSGFMDLNKYVRRGVKVNLATDFGAGNKMSMLMMMDAAYKIAQVHNFSLHPAYAYYIATTGAAHNLGLGDKVGNLEVGLEADFLILDNHATTQTAWRTEQCENISDLLFVHMILGDERTTRAVYINGKRIFVDHSIQLI